MSSHDIDVVIPFCQSDSHLVVDAITSILIQIGVKPLIHVIADNCDIPESLPSKSCIRYYKTFSNLGPGRIANAIAAHHAGTPFMALQDADDIAHSNRLVLQLSKLHDGFEQISAAMIQQALPGYRGSRHIDEPLLKCGGKWGNVPKGRLINSVRAVSLNMFKRVNGFSNLMCSQDLAFDNVTAFLEIPTYCFDIPLAIRRLHPDSITNGPHFTRDPQSGGREILRLQRLMLQQLKDSPTYETAFNQGCLDKAEPLCQVVDSFTKVSV